MMGFLFGLGALLAFGVGDIPSKLGMRGLSALQALFLRYLTLVLTLWLVALGLGAVVIPSPETAGLVLFNTLVGAASIAFFFKALKSMDASIAHPLGRLSVLLTIAFGVAFFGESFAWTQVLGALVILGSGIFISLDFDQVSRKLRLVEGSHYIFLAVLGWSLYFTLLKPIVDSLGPLNASLYSESMVFAYLTLFALVSGERLHLAFDRPTGYMAVSGLVLFVASLSYSFAIGSIGIALTAAIYAGTPVVNAVFARLVLKEKIPWFKYLSIAALVFGLVLLAL